MNMEEAKKYIFEFQMALLKAKDERSLNLFNALNVAIDSMATLETIKEDIERGKHFFYTLENDEKITATFDFVIDLINTRMGDIQNGC